MGISSQNHARLFSYSLGHLYTGRELDTETGVYQYRRRYYTVALARFVSRDPAGFRGGMNLYSYVDNDPTNARDPLGLGKLTTGGVNVTEPDLAVISAYSGIEPANGQPVMDPNAARAAGFDLSGQSACRVLGITVRRAGTLNWRLPFTVAIPGVGMQTIYRQEEREVQLPLGPDVNRFGKNPVVPEDAYYYGFSIEVRIAGDPKKVRVEQWVHGSMTHGVFGTLDPATDLRYRSGPWGLDMTIPPGNFTTQIKRSSISYYDAPYIPNTFWQELWGRDVKIDLKFLVLAYCTDKCGPPAVLKFPIQHEWIRDAAGAHGDPGFMGVGAMGNSIGQK